MGYLKSIKIKSIWDTIYIKIITNFSVKLIISCNLKKYVTITNLNKMTPILANTDYFQGFKQTPCCTRAIFSFSITLKLSK